jgi:NAD(P)-dependent dehydrogenase (short-subunit alcohol dehydrogenase family)
MIKQGGGSIVNIGSLAGVRSLPSMPAYCTSKGALLQLSAQCALEYGPQKIRSNVVAPGATRTEMLVNAMASLSKMINKNALEEVLPESVPLRHPANTEEIAGAVSFLASDDSAFITGTMLLVDGGAAIVDVSGASVARAGAGWGV